MKTIDFIFATSHQLAGEIIEFFTHGEEFSGHAALRFPYGMEYGPTIIEATTKGIRFTAPDAYDNIKELSILTAEVSDEEYQTMFQLAIQIAEDNYKYG